ncbi:MAG: hypothetical protein ACR2G5_13380 [Pyrinomonadaceae bacterium]
MPNRFVEIREAHTLLKLFDRVPFDLPNIWIQGDNSEVIGF